MKELLRKEKEAVKFIRNAYPLALDMDKNGFHLAFSGGKDSQALYHVMEESGCKFTAHMQVTSVDAPNLMSFVRKHYPKVQLHLPKENMYSLILRKGVLPMRQMRYCCQELKEHAGAGTCTCVGVRKYESVNRSKRFPIELNGKKGVEFDIDNGKLVQNNFSFDLFDVSSESVITCVKGNDKIILSPIYNWTNSNVWNYIRGNNIPYCELYDMGFHRLGCLFCPMASKKEKIKELELFSRLAEKVYIRAIQDLMIQGKYQEFNSAEEVFFWWISNSSRDKWLGTKRRQLNIR